MRDPYSRFRKFTLPNGLDVYLAHWNRPWVAAKFVVHAGAREDPSRLLGVAHFVEHVVSDNIPGWGKTSLSGHFEKMGGTAHLGNTSQLATRYGFFAPAETATLEDAFSIFGRMLLEAKLKESIEKEREIIIHEFNRKYPIRQESEWNNAITSTILPSHRPAVGMGTPEMIAEVGENDLQAFYDAFYTPQNISLVVVGGVKAEELKRILRQSPFGQDSGGSRNPMPAVMLTLPKPIIPRLDISLSEHGINNIKRMERCFCWTFPADFDRQARRIFTGMLHRRLNLAIREKGRFSYHVDFGWDDLQDVSICSIKFFVDPATDDRTDETVRQAIDSVLVSPDLFKEVKQTQLASQQLIDASDKELCDIAASDVTLFQRIITITEETRSLRKVRFDRMIEAASYFSPARQFVRILRP